MNEFFREQLRPRRIKRTGAHLLSAGLLLLSSCIPTPVEARSGQLRIGSDANQIPANEYEVTIYHRLPSNRSAYSVWRTADTPVRIDYNVLRLTNAVCDPSEAFGFYISNRGAEQGEDERKAIGCDNKRKPMVEFLGYESAVILQR